MTNSNRTEEYATSGSVEIPLLRGHNKTMIVSLEDAIAIFVRYYRTAF
jgi:hypothetical protein